MKASLQAAVALAALIVVVAAAGGVLLHENPGTKWLMAVVVAVIFALSIGAGMALRWGR